MLYKIIELWKDLPKEDKIEFKPTLKTYILDGTKLRPSVLICPGGGYEHVSEREGEPIALKFNSAGYHAFVLDYHVSPAKHPQPLQDLARAMCIIRENASAWNIHRDKIAVCGFSAGGHLAGSLGVHFDKPYLNIEGITIGENRPNALILSYPVISSGEFAHGGSFINLLGKNPDKSLLHEMSLETQISKKLPPVFIWHTLEDNAVPMENSMLFIQGLRKFNVPFEFHLYPNGSHGLSLATEETDNGCGVYPHVSTWMNLCIEWLNGIFNKI